MNAPDDLQLTCHLCGQEHGMVALRPGETARCVRCSSVMARGRHLGPGASLMFAVTGLVLAFPACLLPFMGAGKLGDQRTSFLFTGAVALWNQGMRAVAILVLFCGGVVPFALLATLGLFAAPARFRGLLVRESDLARLAGLLERWAIPEVQMLAVLVALMKLGSLVHITIGAGFWCYSAMSLALLMAVRGLDMDSLRRGGSMPGASKVK
jgi:paraquat-inducible protein A